MRNLFISGKVLKEQGQLFENIQQVLHLFDKCLTTSKYIFSVKIDIDLEVFFSMSPRRGPLLFSCCHTTRRELVIWEDLN